MGCWAMKIIGLTGSIGMGKSVTANMLRRLGLPVFDSDRCVHGLLSPSGKAFETVALTFPESWDAKKHIINRTKLGEIVFKNEENRRKLESILHPLVWHEQNEFIKTSRRAGHKAVILDIPLLYETGSNRKCDLVICVDAPFVIQKQRVLSRPNMTEDKFYAILSGQIPNLEKKRRADIVIETGLGRAHTFRRLKTMVNELQKGTL